MNVKIVVLAMLLSAPSMATTMAAPHEQVEEKDTHVVTGTLEALDTSKMTGKLKTDLGQTVIFTVTRLELFKGLSVGERIAVRIDDQARVIKVMETTVPELPSHEK